jgi:hypothetical protein
VHFRSVVVIVAFALALALFVVAPAAAGPAWSWHLVLDLGSAALAELPEGMVHEPPPPACAADDPDRFVAYVKEGAHVVVRGRDADDERPFWDWKKRTGYLPGAFYADGVVVVFVDGDGTAGPERALGFDAATRRTLWSRKITAIDFADLAGPYILVATPARLEVLDAHTGIARGTAPLARLRFLGTCTSAGAHLVRTTAGLASIDAADGHVRWTLAGAFGSLVATPTDIVTATLDDTLRVTRIAPDTGLATAHWESSDVHAKVGGDGIDVTLERADPGRFVVHLHGWVE